MPALMRTIPAIAILAMGAASSTATAQCARADVEYYLNKGFSQAQVTAICRSTTPQSDDILANYYAKERDQELNQKADRRVQGQRLLEAAIDGSDIEITKRHLQFTSRLCLKVGESYDPTAREKLCADLKQRIYFKDLEVLGTEQEFLFFGKQQVVVDGNIRRKFMYDLRNLSVAMRRELVRSYRQQVRQGEARIPIRSDYSAGQVMQALRNSAQS